PPSGPRLRNGRTNRQTTVRLVRTTIECKVASGRDSSPRHCCGARQIVRPVATLNLSVGAEIEPGNTMRSFRVLSRFAGYFECWPRVPRLALPRNHCSGQTVVARELWWDLALDYATLVAGNRKGATCRSAHPDRRGRKVSCVHSSADPVPMPAPRSWHPID